MDPYITAKSFISPAASLQPPQASNSLVKPPQAFSFLDLIRKVFFVHHLSFFVSSENFVHT